MFTPVPDDVCCNTEERGGQEEGGGQVEGGGVAVAGGLVHLHNLSVLK